MSCDVGKAAEELENELRRRWSDVRVGEWGGAALPTSQLILQPFCCFTYVTWRAALVPMMMFNISMMILWSEMTSARRIIWRCKLALELKRLKTPTIGQNHKNQRVAICASLLARHRLAREQHRSFVSSIVTGDGKWCLYADIRKTKEWLNPNKMAELCYNFSTWHSIFLASTVTLTIIKWQNFNM